MNHNIQQSFGLHAARLALGDHSFWKKIMAISVPVIAQNLITMGVNMVDNMMLGKLGDAAISGSSQAIQFITIFQICCMGLCMGASVLITRYYGSKDYDSLKEAVTLMLRLVILWSLLFTTAAGLTPGGILRLYSPDKDVIAQGCIYLMWSLPTFLLTGLSTAYTAILRAINQNKIPLFGAVVSFVSNVYFNWVFIFGKLGFPAMGVAGAALGTVIARIIECGIICGYTIFCEKEVQYSLCDIIYKKCNKIWNICKFL